MSFIHDCRAFEEVRRAAADIFVLESRLPSRVYQDSYTWFAFEDFLWTMSAEFWETIQELASISQDNSLTMGVLDPDPQHYFRKELGHYNWINMQTQMTEDNYWNILNEHSPSNSADCLLFNSETVVWFPKSAQWAIWGERVYGICVLGCREFTPVNTWHDIDWALQSGLPNNFGDKSLLKDFQAKLQQNYSPRILTRD